TPQQQKDIRAAAQTYRENPAFKVEDVITELGVGEALVSTLEGKGQPSIVQKTLIRPPSSKIGPASPESKKTIMQSSVLGKKYDQTQDRESAYEILQKRAEQASGQAQQARESASKSKTQSSSSGRSSSRQGVGEAAVKSVVRSVGSSVGRMIARELIRGVMGSLRR
ncbi:MAG: helicase HerA-like domain-containing protein, partial [Alphaproteobacteria bacterium]